MFHRLLVANRGEIALRIIQTAKKMGIETVAIYSKADANSPHLRYADHTICIGPSQSTLSYLNIEAIVQAALQTDCQAIHPGYGFLAENSIFATLCEQYKISFVGPSPRAISNMGDKANAISMMRNAGLSVIPGSGETVADVTAAQAIAKEIGFPLLLKATAGGGGKGMRVCFDERQLQTNFAEASLEAEKAFGNPALYIEKYIQHGRHIEFQVLADSFSQGIHLGERECSVQRRHQKLIEESPSPGVDENLRSTVGQRVVEAISKIGYRNAGTVEFLMDEKQNLYFIEMNTRLQVEHPVTEMITGIDIVEQQIKIAANHALSLRQNEIGFSGHAIECRLNAEDPTDNFQPKPGKITRFSIPQDIGPGKIRVDTFVEEGCYIPPFYDSMICKVITWGQDRREAIATMDNVLANTVIEGVPTTAAYARKILQTDMFRSGNYSTKIVEQV